MKLFSIIRTGIIASLLVLMVGCAPKSESVGSIYRFDGIEPAVYYTAVSPIEEGFDGETAVIVIGSFASQSASPRFGLRTPVVFTSYFTSSTTRWVFFKQYIQLSKFHGQQTSCPWK